MKMKTGVTIAVLTLAIAGCTSAQEKMADAGKEPLSAEEVRNALSDATERGTNSEGTNYVVYRGPDGEIRGKAWGSWGTSTDTGTWSVEPDGTFCTQYNEWRDGIRRCWKIYEDGDTYVLAGVTAAAQDDEIRKDQLSDGNPENL